MDLDKACAILKVDPRVNEAQLKQRYRALALELHPDKSRYSKDDANAIFARLTEAYKVVMDAARGARPTASFHEMRKEATAAPSPLSRAPKRMTEDFDQERFNNVFEDTKVRDYMDDGYDAWLKSVSAEEEPQEDTLAIYREPDALTGSSLSRSIYEYGVSRVKDFSADNTSNGELCYMDLRKAYAAPKEQALDRREFRDVEDIKQHRAAMSFEMTKEDRERVDARARENERTESDRAIRMRKMDDLHRQRFEKVNRLMLST